MLQALLDLCESLGVVMMRGAKGSRRHGVHDLDELGVCSADASVPARGEDFGHRLEVGFELTGRVLVLYGEGG